MTRSMKVLLALTHAPMAAFLAGIVPISVGVLLGLEQHEAELLRGDLAVSDHITAAQWVWTACLVGFAAACCGGTLLTLWAQRQLRARVDDQLAFCEALVHGQPLPALRAPDGDGTLARMDRRLQQLGSALEQRDEMLRRDAQSERIHTRLARAMAMTDDEAEVLDLTSLALGAFLPDANAEVLIADSSMAHMSQVLERGQAPGCQVLSPSKCHAVRRGSAQVFDDSAALDACPKLRSRGRLSAACVPISVMGRAVGVLHVAGPHGQAPDAEVVSQLTFVADQLGTRMGMLQALSTSQLQADTDPLTGLLNRRSFEARATRMLQGEDCTVVMADLDHFKRLNDTFGHSAGDKALRVFSRLGRELLGPHGLVGRYGGEEFIFLFPAGQDQVRDWLEALREAMPGAIEAASAPVFTASFGMAEGPAHSDLDALVRVADQALYRAKEAGRDRIEGNRRKRAA